MPDDRSVTEILRRTTLLNLRMYKRAVDLSLEYLRDLGTILQARTVAAPQTAPARGDDAGDGAGGAESGVIVLEAESGATATAAFLVTNELDRAVTIAMRATPIESADGDAVDQPVEFSPGRVELGAGNRQLVTVSAKISTALTPGLPYRGEVSVDGMKGMSVPLVLRRRHTIEESAAAPAPQQTSRRKTGSRAARSAAD